MQESWMRLDVAIKSPPNVQKIELQVGVTAPGAICGRDPSDCHMILFAARVCQNASPNMIYKKVETEHVLSW